MDIGSISGIKGISHIALVVPDLDKADKEYSLLGFKTVINEVNEEKFEVRAKVIERNGYVIELICPLSKDNPNYARYMKEKKYGLDHICYEVDDLESVVEELKRYHFFSASSERISGVWGRKVILMANRRMGIIELIEREKEEV